MIWHDSKDYILVPLGDAVGKLQGKTRYERRSGAHPVVVSLSLFSAAHDSSIIALEVRVTVLATRDGSEIYLIDTSQCRMLLQEMWCWY